MQSFVKKTLVVFAVAMLLLSAVLVPGITSADEQPSPSASKNWQTDPSVSRAYNAQTGALNYVSFPPDVRGNYNFVAQNRQDALDNFAAFASEFQLGDTPLSLIPPANRRLIVINKNMKVSLFLVVKSS
jgi:hypothetical protein